MPTRTFTIDELADLGVPPDSPGEDDFSDYILADEHIDTLKYTQQRRCVFEDENGDTWAVEYETELDMGDYEVGDGGPDNHGWYGGTVEAVAVEERQVMITQWVEIDEEDEN